MAVTEWQTCDRHYSFTETTFTKRELHKHEWRTNRWGELVVPTEASQYLQNETAALEFIAANTTIPVPKVLEFSFKDGIYSLTMERLTGVTLDRVKKDKRKALMNTDRFINEHVLPQFRKLKSCSIGSVLGVIIPPERVRARRPRGNWPPKSSSVEEYIYCHNDLGQQNIMIDEETLQVVGIVDWEQSGYFPPEFESPLWLKSWKEWAEDNDDNESEAERLKDFLLDPEQKALPKAIHTSVDRQPRIDHS